MNFRATVLAGISAAAMAVGSSAAIAQETAPLDPQAPATESAPQAAPMPDVDDSKLESFAVAFLQVSEIAQQYQPQFESAGNDEDRQRVQQEAGQRMVEAVESSDGITIDEYNQIIQAAQADPDLAQRINGHITGAAQ